MQLIKALTIISLSQLVISCVPEPIRITNTVNIPHHIRSQTRIERGQTPEDALNICNAKVDYIDKYIKKYNSLVLGIKDE